MRKIEPVVKQNEESPIAVEILADSIVKVSDAAQKLLKSGLNRRALITLLFDITPADVGRTQIGMVLDALPRLRENFTTPKKSEPAR